METIPILVTVPDEDETQDEMGIFGTFHADGTIGAVKVPTQVLKENLTNVAETVIGLVEEIKRVGRFKLQEVTIQVEVTAEGGVQLIGTANLGGKGAITLSFTE